MRRLAAVMAALVLTVSLAAVTFSIGYAQSPVLIETETATVTAPPETVEVTRTIRAARSAPRGVKRPVTTSPTAPGASGATSASGAGGRAEYQSLNRWQRAYWNRAQAWAATPKAKAVARCESGDRVNAVSPSGRYRGIWQLDANAWASYGGLALAPRPDLATRAGQNYTAYRLFVGRSWSPWACA